MFKVNNKDIRATFLTWLSGVFIVNFEYISYIVLVFPLLAFNNYMPAGKVMSTKHCDVEVCQK